MVPFRRHVAILAVAAAALASCGDDTDPPVDDPDAPADDAAAADPDTDAADDPDADPAVDDPDPDAAADDPDAAGDVDLGVATTELGEILVDGDGMTLYLFTDDPPGESVCEDACLEAWPPLLVADAPVVGDDVDEALVDTITREDGDTQVTYDQAPLYLWASDQAPGDVTGQGVQDVWYVVAPSGAAIVDGDADDDGDDGEDGGRDYR